MVNKKFEKLFAQVRSSIGIAYFSVRSDEIQSLYTERKFLFFLFFLEIELT